MSSLKKIITTVNVSWMAITILGVAPLFFAVHDNRQLADLARQCCWILVGINFLVVAGLERNWKYKIMFLNFFFVAGILRILDLAAFLGFFRGFSSDKFVDHYVYQYLSCGLIPTAQFFTVLYAGMVFTVKKISVRMTYLASSLIVLPIAFVMYYPYVENPKHLYTVKDITDFRIIDRAIKEFEHVEKKSPKDENLAMGIGLTRREIYEGRGELTVEERIERIREIRPYIEGQNYLLLLFRPIHVHVSLVNLFCVGVLLGVLLFQFVIDPPQSPYIDKMFLVLLVNFSFESLHYFIYSRTVELDSYWDQFTISAVLSLVSILLLLPVLWMRLAFSRSAESKYYQDKIEFSPSQVSRWRDRIDNAILQSLVGRTSFSKRFVISRRKREQKGRTATSQDDPKLVRKKSEELRKNT